MTEKAGSGLLGTLAFLMAYWGYLVAVNTGAAPLLAAEFELDDAQIATVFGWIALAAFGTLLLSRMADRIGRRRVLLVSFAGIPLLALASAGAWNLDSYVVAQIGLHALRGALQTAILVMVAEVLPLRDRARGQSVVGVSGALGSGLALIVIPLLAHTTLGWRWAWLGAALPVLAFPALRRALPETLRFERAAARGEAGTARLGDLFRGAYLGRAVGVLVMITLTEAAITATQTWIIHHPMTNLGLSPEETTGIIIVAGLLGLVGFPLGSRLADNRGRRGTFAVSGVLYALASIGFYTVPADWGLGTPASLALFFLLMMIFSNVATVAYRSAATELFPTRLRGTLLGWMAISMAVSTVLSQFGVAFLTRALEGEALRLGAALAAWTGGFGAQLDGLALATSLLGLAMLPAVGVALALLPETAGLELEAAALEEVDAYVAVGSNLGRREEHLAAAVAALGATPGVGVRRLSPIYETDPVGPGPQGPYLNAVVEIRTALRPQALLARLQEIERERGRERGPVRNAPRTLDLDLLLYGFERVETPGLVVPHPRMAERGFVLAPLRDLAPGLVHPALGETIETLARRVHDPAAVRPWKT